MSALPAATGLWLGAGPIAHLMQKASLTGLMRWTAISAVGIILLECARGFFIGQSRLPALMILSVIAGSGMVLLVLLAARTDNPIRMVVLQGAIMTSAVVVCLLLSSRLGLNAPAPSATALPLWLMLREVWGFGVVQLGGLIGVNFAGWWLTTLLARSDTTLVQISFFAIASQLRNVAGLAPSMFTESSYAVMADREDCTSNTPQQLMAPCTFAATAGAFALAGIGILLTTPSIEADVWTRIYRGGVRCGRGACCGRGSYGKRSRGGAIVDCAAALQELSRRYGRSWWRARRRCCCCITAVRVWRWGSILPRIWLRLHW